MSEEIKGRTTEEFIESHGAKELLELKQQLAIEKNKVAALMGKSEPLKIVNSAENTIKFALLSDTHFGSLYAHTDAVKGFYEYAASRGVTDFYHSGDVLEGYGMYAGQEFEVRAPSIEEQLRDMEEQLPRIGCTHFITGNHDLSFHKRIGLDVGRAIIGVRPDMEWLGDRHGRVQFNTPNGPYVLGLMHPSGGTAYAISYKPQNIIRDLEGGTKPNMLAIGHFHKAEMLPTYRNICLIQSATLQRQTPYMKSKPTPAHMGGWLIEVVVGAEGHNVIRSEFVAFY